MASTPTPDRSYETWKQQVDAVLQTTRMGGRYLVSNRAKPLIALAQHRLHCLAVADLFHDFCGLSRGLDREIGQQLSRVDGALSRLMTVDT